MKEDAWDRLLRVSADHYEALCLLDQISAEIKKLKPQVEAKGLLIQGKD